MDVGKDIFKILSTARESQMGEDWRMQNDSEIEAIVEMWIFENHQDFYAAYKSAIDTMYAHGLDKDRATDLANRVVQNLTDSLEQAVADRSKETKRVLDECIRISRLKLGIKDE